MGEGATWLLVCVIVVGVIVVAYARRRMLKEEEQFRRLAESIGMTQAPGEDFGCFAERVRSRMESEQQPTILDHLQEMGYDFDNIYTEEAQ